MRPIPAPRIGDSHGLLRAIDQRGRLRTDEFMTEFSLEQLFPPDLENALGRMRHFISYARSAGLVKEDRGVVELTEPGRRYVKAGDAAAPYDVSPLQAEWLRRLLREKHMTDSIFHGLAISVSLLASRPPGEGVSTMDFGRSLAYLGRAGWDNENTFQIQGERYLVLLRDMEMTDEADRLTATGETVRGELTLPIHMSLIDIATQLNPGGLEAVRAQAAAEAAQRAPEEPEEPEEIDEPAPAVETPDAEPETESGDEDGYADVGPGAWIAPETESADADDEPAAPPVAGEPAADSAAVPDEPGERERAAAPSAGPPVPSDEPGEQERAAAPSAGPPVPSDEPGEQGPAAAPSAGPPVPSDEPGEQGPAAAPSAGPPVPSDSPGEQGPVAAPSAGPPVPSDEPGEQDPATARSAGPPVPPDEPGEQKSAAAPSAGPPVPPDDIWDTAAPDDATRALAAVRPPVVPRAGAPDPQRAGHGLTSGDPLAASLVDAATMISTPGARTDPATAEDAAPALAEEAPAGEDDDAASPAAAEGAPAGEDDNAPSARAGTGPEDSVAAPGGEASGDAVAAPGGAATDDAVGAPADAASAEAMVAPGRPTSGDAVAAPGGAASGEAVVAPGRPASGDAVAAPAGAAPGNEASAGVASEDAVVASAGAGSGDDVAAPAGAAPGDAASAPGGAASADGVVAAGGVASGDAVAAPDGAALEDVLAGSAGPVSGDAVVAPPGVGPGGAVGAPARPSSGDVPGAPAGAVPEDASVAPEPVAARPPAHAPDRGDALLAAPQRAPAARVSFLDAGAVRAAAEDAGLRLPAGVYANVTAALGAGKHLLLTGAPGAGKTTLALAIARVAAHAGRAKGATLVTAAHRWSDRDTIGRPGRDGEPARPGFLLEAARRGRWLIVDELDRAQPDRALGSLTAFLAGLPVALPTGEEAAAGPDWRIVATWGGAPPRGAAAVLRRFAVIEVPAPPAAALDRALVAAAGGDQVAADAIRRLLAFADLAPLGAGVFLDAARHAAARHAIEPADELTLAREAFAAYVAPLLGELDDEGARHVRDLMGG
jgi:MoxR-like ATPase